MNTTSKASARRWLRRASWENVAAGVIGLGIAMQMQPFALELYTWSFAVIAAGTAGFIVATHLPE
jgi:Na+(H+)/acetate symporter ActP